MKSYRLDDALIANIEAYVAGVRERHDGGPGSGNWGHLGRPGHWGGSAKGSGGKQNRREGDYRYGVPGDHAYYTSRSKQRDLLAKKHKMSTAEAEKLPGGSVINVDGKKYFKKNGKSKVLKPMDDPKGKGVHIKKLDGKEVKVALPRNSNPNVKMDPSNRNEERRVRLENTAHNESDAAADAKLRKAAGEAYNKMTKLEKSALASYTGKGRRAMDRKMADGTENKGAYSRRIKRVKDALNKAVIDHDVAVTEGMTDKQALKHFNWTKEQYEMAFASERPGDILGGSVGSKGNGIMSGKAGPDVKRTNGLIVHRNIRAGTKGLDSEAFSSSGNGAGRDWDGKSSQSSYSKNHEVLIPPGYQEVVVRAWAENGVKHVETDVVPIGDGT